LGELDAAALRFEEAVAHYREVGSAESDMAMAEALSKLGGNEEAIEALERALTLLRDPRSRARARYLEARVRLERADEKSALAALLEARRLDPYHLETRYLLGTTLARLGRAEEARAELDSFRKLKAFEQEKEKLEHAILERPEDGESYRPLIELYLDSGRQDEARVFLEKALLLSPESPHLRELERRAR
jgi:tetratricopeptide (TPR) repeat protein